MDWGTIIVSLGGALLTGGGFMSLLYYRENRRAKQIDNEKSVVDEWQELANERKLRCDELKESLDRKDAKIDALYKENADLRKRNDKLSSANTALSILKCKVISCDKRQPPFGKGENANIENIQ
jgi:hypothetical protein